MDRFQEMQVFVRIAERHSFTQTTDDLQMPRATVTNLMKRMEERLGARLLERTTRTVRLTHDGEEHYRRCVRLIADLEEAEGSFRHAAPKGLLRVNLQGTLARHFIVPELPAFMARYRRSNCMWAKMIASSISCVKAWIACCAGTLQDSSMIGRRVALLEQVTPASPSYLERHGMPGDLDSLASHRAVNYVSSATGRVIPLEFTLSEGVQAVELPASISVTGVELYTQAARLRDSASFRCRVITSTMHSQMAGCTRCCRIFRHRRCPFPCCIRIIGSYRHVCGFLRTGLARSFKRRMLSKKQRGQFLQRKLASHL